MAKGKMKKVDLNDLGGFVFSTNPEFEAEGNDDNLETLDANQQLLEVYNDKKSRAGKTVCLIKGFVGTDEDLKTLGKELKSHCGVGGSAKDGEIIVQGNVRDKVITFLNKKGYKTKRVGG
jgi:translation initiation factor 1